MRRRGWLLEQECNLFFYRTAEDSIARLYDQRAHYAELDSDSGVALQFGPSYRRWVARLVLFGTLFVAAGALALRLHSPDSVPVFLAIFGSLVLGLWAVWFRIGAVQLRASRFGLRAEGLWSAPIDLAWSEVRTLRYRPGSRRFEFTGVDGSRILVSSFRDGLGTVSTLSEGQLTQSLGPLSAADLACAFRYGHFSSVARDTVSGSPERASEDPQA